MKQIKKHITIIMSLLICIGVATVDVNATELSASDNNQGVVDVNKEASDEYYFSEENQKLSKEKESTLTKKRYDPLNPSSVGYANVPGYLQETDYYCGPASVKNMIAMAGKGVYSQDTLAQYMGTTEASGTDVGAIARCLNAYTNDGYAVSSVYSVNYMAALANNVDQGYGVAANVDTRSLNDGYPFSGGHYVVGCGYMYLNQTVRYYDVWYGNGMPGYHTVSTSHMVNAIKAQYGYFVW